MTIYSDAIGNRFLGDCIWANHNISHPSTKFLKAEPFNTLASEITSWVMSSGLKYRNLASQATYDALLPNNSGGVILGRFGANSDTIDDRYLVRFGGFDGAGSGSADPSVFLFNNSGDISTGETLTSNTPLTNQLYQLRTASTQTNVFYDSAISGRQFTGVANSESLAFFGATVSAHRFLYCGLLDDVNTNFDYYSASNITKSILMTCNSPQNIQIGHYIAGGGKLCLTTGDAQYPIVCADAQTPTSQWATDMYVFDNNAGFGYPAIGRVRNLLFGQGAYTIGKPVKIQGSVMPDAGFNRWLPVGTFGDKTVLMRCYSSVNI